VDWKEIIGVEAFNLDRVLNFEPEFLTDLDAEHQHDETVASCSVKFEGELMVHGLSDWINDLIQTKGADLFRYKGVLAVKGMDKKFIFQGVGMLFSGDFTTEWQPTDNKECRFVFIGKNLNKKTLTDGFLACKCDAVLRFKVGDEVLANVGGPSNPWAVGKIIKIWDEGNPYRIELSNGDNVWGPIDEDAFVRAPAAA